jgi:hypothetical protein
VGLLGKVARLEREDVGADLLFNNNFQGTIPNLR